MLLGAVFSDVLRAISLLEVEFAMFRGSVGPWLRAGDFGAFNGCAGGGGGGCDTAVPGATGGRVGVCCETFEGLREWIGTFVVVVVVVDAGAGRV